MEVFITTLIHTNILQKHTAVLNILINFQKKNIEGNSIDTSIPKIPISSIQLSSRLPCS